MSVFPSVAVYFLNSNRQEVIWDSGPDDLLHCLCNMFSSRRYYAPPDDLTVRRLTRWFHLNKDMYDKKANQVPPGAERANEEIHVQLFGLMCSNAYDRDDPDKVVSNFMEIGRVVSELGAMRLRGVDAYDLLEEQAKTKDLQGLLIGYKDDSWSLHVQRERPYLFAPLRALAALETLLDIWGDNGKEFWAGGLGYCVTYFYYMSIGDNPDARDANKKAWSQTRDDRYGPAAKALFYLQGADNFEDYIKGGLIVPDEVLQERLWFLHAADFVHIHRNLDRIRRRIIEGQPC